MNRSTILFLPVSSPVGIGEFQRCVLLAHGLTVARPDARIVFGLSVQAGVPDGFPFEVEWLPRSPTLSTPQVIALLRRERPSVVFYDNAGRSAQFEEARRLGARVLFLASFPAARRRGFGLRRMASTNELWLVDAVRPITWSERLAMRFFPQVRIRTLDAVFAPPDQEAAAALLRARGVEGPFMLLVATRARTWFAELAHEVACRGPLPVVFGGGDDGITHPSLTTLGLLPHEVLMGLVARSELVVCGTGSMAEEAACFARPLVVVPVTREWRKRAKLLERRGAVVRARCDLESATATVVRVAGDPVERARLAAAAAERGLRNGYEEAIQAITAALGPAVSR